MKGKREGKNVSEKLKEGDNKRRYVREEEKIYRLIIKGILNDEIVLKKMLGKQERVREASDRGPSIHRFLVL